MSTSVTSFMDAVRSRYGAADDTALYDADAFLVSAKDTSAKDKSAKDKSGRERGGKKWELVGMEQARQRQAQHSRLVHVGLRGMRIAAAERGAGEIARAAMDRVAELDLSDNPALRMRHVAHIARHLPALAALQLCENPQLLSNTHNDKDKDKDDSDESDNKHSECNDRDDNNNGSEGNGVPMSVVRLEAPRLRKIVLNAVGLKSLAQLRALAELPVLEEVHLDNNDIERLLLSGDEQEEEEERKEEKGEGGTEKNGVAGWFPGVKTLSLGGNRIAAWGRESGLHKALRIAFPRVTRLFLTGNSLPNLHSAPETTEDLAYLQQLELLCVNENPTITDPGTIDVIRELCPRLTTFRITYGPMFPQWNETLGRMHVVASLPGIAVLNRGEVRPKERLDSELFYVQRGLAARLREEERQNDTNQNDEKPGAGEQQTALSLLRYPLLDTLREKHKDVILAIYSEGDTASHDGTTHLMLNLTLRCDGFEATQKRVPSSLSVGKLKALIRVVFGITPANQRISYFTSDTAVFGCPTPLDNEICSIGFYGVCDGGIIHVVDTSLR